MPSDPAPAAAPPSVFTSYASADQEAARALTETLTKAGLDVWLDQEELAGGEAWDAKIRHQIRTCTFFMPIISATTEARHEGYFRREWRLAVERTLDLADDVLFLVPVVIDGTRDHGARVPEKFMTVQWLRCPGGRETPQLVALARRLATERGVMTARPIAPPVITVPAASKDGRGRDLPPMQFPEFPAFPAPGHRPRFVYDLVVWSGRMSYALWLRVPRAVRYVATVMIVFKMIGLVFDRSNSPHSETAEEKTARAANVVKLLSDPKTNGDQIGQKVLQATGAALDALQSGRPLAIVAFSVSDPSVRESAQHVFAGLHEQLTESGHDGQVAVSLAPLSAGADDASVLNRATGLKCRWIAVGTVRPAVVGDFTLELKLYETASGKIVWWAQRSGDTGGADSVGKTLAHDLLEHVAFDPPNQK